MADNVLAVFNYFEPHKHFSGRSHRLVVEAIVEQDGYGDFITFGKVYLARGEQRREIDVSYELGDELAERAIKEAERAVR